MRLFWNTLCGYFLAWALLSLALFGALALDARTRFLPRPAVSQNLPSAVSVQMAATNVRFGGEGVFRRMVERWPRAEPPFVVDNQGREVLGREVDPDVLAAARSLAIDSAEQTPVKLVTDPDGREFVIYHPEGTGPQDGGVFYWLLEQPWLLGIVFAGAGLAIAGGLTAAWTRPIGALEAAFDALSEGHVPVEVDPRITQRRDELGDLGRRFEQMSRRLAESNGAQRQLLHDVSHELRSPLARLSVATAWARRRPDRVEEALERIEQECQRLDRLIGGVLTLARLESDVAPALDEYFDLYELLRVIHEDVAFEANAVGIDVTLTVPDRAELVMLGNAELLRRAIENVVRNALQHASGSDRIEILLDDAPAGESVVVRVRDRGKGLTDEELRSLFEPFRRGRTSAGFGLGLAIALRAVAVHRGSIRASNLPAGGVEVEIRLPRDTVRRQSGT